MVVLSVSLNSNTKIALGVELAQSTTGLIPRAAELASPSSSFCFASASLVLQRKVLCIYQYAKHFVFKSQSPVVRASCRCDILPMQGREGHCEWLRRCMLAECRAPSTGHPNRWPVIFWSVFPIFVNPSNATERRDFGLLLIQWSVLVSTVNQSPPAESMPSFVKSE